MPAATWVKGQHEGDLAGGLGAVALPGNLRAKYPAAAFDWAWQWVFPATRFYQDAKTGERRRHHLHESVVQRAVKDAVRALTNWRRDSGGGELGYADREPREYRGYAGRPIPVFSEVVALSK